MMRGHVSTMQYSPTHATAKTAVGGEHGLRLFQKIVVRVTVYCYSYVCTRLEMSFANNNALSG